MYRIPIQNSSGKSSRVVLLILFSPFLKRPCLVLKMQYLNAALRLEYVDWNKGKFKSTGGNIADDVFSIVPAISWRPTAQTVIRFNYRYNWQKDILGNPPSKLAGFQFGLCYLFLTRGCKHFNSVLY